MHYVFWRDRDGISLVRVDADGHVQDTQPILIGTHRARWSRRSSF